MNAGQLKDILLEYPGSRKLKVIVQKEVVMEMTVIELIIKLLECEKIEALFTFFGFDNCIVRERGEMINDVAGAAPWRDWIELDLR